MQRNNIGVPVYMVNALKTGTLLELILFLQDNGTICNVWESIILLKYFFLYYFNEYCYNDTFKKKPSCHLTAKLLSKIFSTFQSTLLTCQTDHAFIIC